MMTKAANKKSRGVKNGRAESVFRQENLYLMRQCIADARNVLADEKMMDMQSHVLSIA